MLSPRELLLYVVEHVVSIQLASPRMEQTIAKGMLNVSQLLAIVYGAPGQRSQLAISMTDIYQSPGLGPNPA